MKEYHKIDSVYKRDEKGKFIIGEFSRPEFEYLADLPWRWTEKIDGTNIRIMWDGKDVRYGGKTDNAQIPVKLLSWLENQEIFVGPNEGEFDQTFNPHTFHDLFGGDGNVCLYGEGYGAGIQSGGNYSPDQKFILFDVKIGDWWLERENIEDIATKLGLDVVPALYKWNPTLREIVKYVQEFEYKIPTTNLIGGTGPVEGYVGTPVVPLFNRKGERIITKVKYRDFR